MSLSDQMIRLHALERRAESLNCRLSEASGSSYDGPEIEFIISLEGEILTEILGEDGESYDDHLDTVEDSIDELAADMVEVF